MTRRMTKEELLAEKKARDSYIAAKARETELPDRFVDREWLLEIVDSMETN